MIYVVEDDKSIRELVVYTLSGAGFEARGCTDGEEFFEALRDNAAELLLLDIMLPGENGIEILKRIRRDRSLSDTPVILMTALGSEYDKVSGLDSGADDYITKPFGMMELVSRVRAVLRRGKRREGGALSAGAIEMDCEGRNVRSGGETVILTYKEFELLRALMENKGRVLTRDNLLDDIWGYEFYGGTRTVDVHIRTLRQKLGDAADVIETVRGVGYRIGEGK